MHRRPTNLGALRAAWRNTTDDVVSRETPCFRISNADGDKPKLYVYDVIGGWDNDSAEFVKAVHTIDADALDLHINSPGGFVYDGVAMFEALQESPARVDVHVDGLAASAASFLAMAGDTVEIAKAGRMMIHDAQGVGIGGPADLRDFADLLDEVSNDIAGYYSGRAGGSAAAWRKTMSATTWYSAQQAVDAKLADRVSGKKIEGPDNRSRLITARHRVLTTLGG